GRAALARQLDAGGRDLGAVGIQGAERELDRRGGGTRVDDLDAKPRARVDRDRQRDLVDGDGALLAVEEDDPGIAALEREGVARVLRRAHAVRAGGHLVRADG